jgi:hypothetical protein
MAHPVDEAERKALHRFKMATLSPPVWIQRGEDLLSAAVLLEKDVCEAFTFWSSSDADGFEADTNGIIGIYFMLLAFAAENLVKAKLIRLNRERVAEEMLQKGGLPPFLKSHDLLSLSLDAGFQSTPEDEEALRRLSRVAVWDGRYPVPANIASLTDPPKRPYSIYYAGGDFRQSDIGATARAIQRLREQLDLWPPA